MIPAKGVVPYFRINPYWVLSILLSTPLTAQVLDTTLNRELHEKIAILMDTNLDSALLYRDSLYRNSIKMADHVGIIDSYLDLGSYHLNKGNYAESINLFSEAYRLCIEHKNQDRLITALRNIGMVYNRLGDYPKAIDNYLESLKLSESLNKKSYSMLTYNSLGVTYKNYGHDAEALKSYKRSIQLANDLGLELNIAGTSINIGNLLMSKLEFDSAILYLEKALFTFDSLKNLRGKIVCVNNLGLAYVRKKKPGEAYPYFKLALDISRAQNYFTSEISALQGLSKVSDLRGNLADAQKYLGEALELSIKKNYRSKLIELYLDFAELHKKAGDISKALYYFEKYSALKDSLFNSESSAKISNLRIAYEVENKERDIKVLMLDNEVARISRNFAILGIVLVLLIAGMIFTRQRLKIKFNAQLFKKQEELYLTQKAVSFLEMKNAKMKEAELQHELDYKNQALSTYALNLVQKNEIMEEVRLAVEQIIKNPIDQQSQFKQLSKLVDYSLSLDKDWDDFKLYFNEVHHGFFNDLQSRFPDISNSELKLCALLRLNLNMKQMATILRISPESVKMARHRLRKKFNLQTEDNLVGFIMSI